MKIKALLLDFGGVLYDIDPQRTINEFMKLSTPNSKFRELTEYNYSTMPFLSEYEKGAISSEQFRDQAAALLGIAPSIAIDNAWNQTLLGVKANMDRVLEELAADYPLYLLSNTNEIHHNYFAEECEVIFKTFTKCYFSYQMNIHKPDLDIFTNISNELSIAPNEILFADDMQANIDAANQLGFNTYKVDEQSNSMYNLSNYLHSVSI